MPQPSKSLEGRRVRCVKSNDSFSPVPNGSEGVVELVDDTGTLHVKWDDGQKLGLCWDNGDRWNVLP